MEEISESRAMSNLLDCCSPCPTSTPPVNIPGPPGASITGPPGVDGVNSFSILLADFLVPPDLVTPVTITVTSSLWMVIGQILIIGQGGGVALANPGPATFIVSSISSPGTVTIKALQYPGDVAFGSTISAGAIVSISGTQPTLATPWSIANGGTGAATKAAAQTSLGLGQDSVISSGAALAQAITAAFVQVGAIDVQIPAAGSWELRGHVAIDFAGVTFAASRTITAKIRNITQGTDLGNAIITTQTQTTQNFPSHYLVLPAILYAGAVANDHLQILIMIDVVNSAGTLSVASGNLEAIPLRKS